MRFAFAALVVFAQLLPFQSTSAQSEPGPTSRELRAAYTDYERALRRFAPFRFGQSSSGYCDEIVGRFCLTYDTGSDPPLPPEPERVKQARQRTIGLYQDAFSRSAGDTLIAAPLVRFLIEDGRAREALTAAERFAQASSDSAWSWMLLGLAQHASRNDVAAESSFDRALALVRSEVREGWTDVAVLLAPQERPRYRSIPVAERAPYEERLWRLADPLYLTPGNESRAEHFARHVYARILSRAPVVMGGYSWADDMDELNSRFGPPVARTQNGSRSPETSITEHYHPDQQTYIPPELLLRGGLKQYDPGAAWPYDTVRARSGFAPATVRSIRVLEHQLSRIPMPDSLLVRVDARMQLDSLTRPPARVEIGLFALDSTWVVIGSAQDTVVADRDTVMASLTMRWPDRAIAYSVEMRELDSLKTARSRYLLPQPLPARPLISDVMILPGGADGLLPRTDSAFRPLTSLVIRRGAPFSLYIEARGLQLDADRQVRYRIELEVQEESRPGTFSRAVNRLGRALGLGGDEISPRITWNERKPGAEVIPISLNLGQLQLDPGLKRLRITIIDEESGLSAMIDRMLRVRR